MDLSTAYLNGLLNRWLQSCDELRRQQIEAVNDAHRRQTEEIFSLFNELRGANTPSSFPKKIEIEFVVPFKYRPEKFSKERLRAFYTTCFETRLFDPTHNLYDFEKGFQWRFDANEHALVKDTIRCGRISSDLIWAFSLLEKCLGISTAPPLAITLPHHFIQKNGTPLSATTVDRTLRRIRNEEYKVKDDLREAFLPLFSK